VPVCPTLTSQVARSTDTRSKRQRVLAGPTSGVHCQVRLSVARYEAFLPTSTSTTLPTTGAPQLRLRIFWDSVLRIHSTSNSHCSCPLDTRHAMDRSLASRFTSSSTSDHRHEAPAVMDSAGSASAAARGGAGRRVSDPGGEVNYAEEGRKILARVNLASSDQEGAGLYAPCNAMYRHPSGGGVLFVGNEQVSHVLLAIFACGSPIVVVAKPTENKAKQSKGTPLFATPIYARTSRTQEHDRLYILPHTLQPHSTKTHLHDCHTLYNHTQHRLPGTSDGCRN
jgi:hypothetical protein